jgi:hypothetical protein
MMEIHAQTTFVPTEVALILQKKTNYYVTMTINAPNLIDVKVVCARERPFPPTAARKIPTAMTTTAALLISAKKARRPETARRRQATALTKLCPKAHNVTSIANGGIMVKLVNAMMGSA